MSLNDTDQSSPLRRLFAAQEAAMRRAGALALLAGALWPVQAAAIAVLVGLWAAADGPLFPASLWPVAIFAAAGLTRAALDARAGALAFEAASAAQAEARVAVLSVEASRSVRTRASGEISALLAQKLPLLAPYATRYRPAIWRAAVLPAGLILLVAIFSWAAALVLLVAVPLIPLFQALVGMAAKEASARQMQEIGDLNALLVDRLVAAPDIRLLGAEARAVAGFAARAEGLRERTMAVLRIAFLSSTVLELFAALGVALVAVYVGFSLLGEIRFGAWAAPLTLSEGVFVLLLAPEVFAPLRELAAAWHDKTAADAVAEDVAQVLDDPDPGILGQGRAAAPLPGPATLSLRGARVDRGAATVALPDLDLRPGEAVALTGPSGAGKTSTLLACAGLLPLAGGRIDVAGRPLDGASADAWRARLAWMPQQVRMPDTTLGAFLDPHGTGADPGPALAAARAGEVVAALPEGLRTRLGESGAGVSGGEARRLMLARLLMQRPDLALVDEPTADLDDATAGCVIAALRALAAGGTAVLAATHDAAVAAACDRSARIAPTWAGG